MHRHAQGMPTQRSSDRARQPRNRSIRVARVRATLHMLYTQGLSRSPTNCPHIRRSRRPNVLVSGLRIEQETRKSAPTWWRGAIYTLATTDPVTVPVDVVLWLDEESAALICVDRPSQPRTPSDGYTQSAPEYRARPQFQLVVGTYRRRKLRPDLRVGSRSLTGGFRSEGRDVADSAPDGTWLVLATVPCGGRRPI